MWLYEKLTTITFMWFCRINKVVDIVVLISLTSVKFLQFIQCFCRRNPKLKLIIKSKKITIHSFLNGLNYRSWLNQWTVYSFKYGWDNIQIYLIYISIDTVFRPRRTHQYGSIHQILILQLTGLEPWILRLWIKHANHCSIKPRLGNEIGTRELNQLIISWGPCIMLISTSIHYHRELKFSGLNKCIYIYLCKEC